ncbi:MAG: cell surface protein, partial [Muribaculaceae bacterium]|nr:cell surface protein [Muribaculaceae bacterium]
MNKPQLILLAIPLLCACSHEIPTVNLGIDDVYYIPRMSKLPLEPALTGEAYEWKVNGETVSTQNRYIFIARE